MSTDHAWTIAVSMLFAGRQLLELTSVEDENGNRELTAADKVCILALNAFPSSSQTELVAILGRDKTTLSRTLLKLETEGLVTSKIDPLDGRRKMLILTEEARGIARSMMDIVVGRIFRVIKTVPPDDTSACARIMSGISDDLLVAKNN